MPPVPSSAKVVVAAGQAQLVAVDQVRPVVGHVGSIDSLLLRGRRTLGGCLWCMLSSDRNEAIYGGRVNMREGPRVFGTGLLYLHARKSLTKSTREEGDRALGSTAGLPLGLPLMTSSRRTERAQCVHFLQLRQSDHPSGSRLSLLSVAVGHLVLCQVRCGTGGGVVPGTWQFSRFCRFPSRTYIYSPPCTP